MTESARDVAARLASEHLFIWDNDVDGYVTFARELLLWAADLCNKEASGVDLCERDAGITVGAQRCAATLKAKAGELK